MNNIMFNTILYNAISLIVYIFVGVITVLVMFFLLNNAIRFIEYCKHIKAKKEFQEWIDKRDKEFSIKNNISLEELRDMRRECREKFLHPSYIKIPCDIRIKRIWEIYRNSNIKKSSKNTGKHS